MASRKSYPCFKCRDNGFDNVMVYLAGKDNTGKTVYVEEDGSPHVHQQQPQQQEVSQRSQQNEQPSEYEKSVDNGISAFSMMTDLIRLVEQNQKLLVTLTEKVDHLTKLVFVQQQQQKGKEKE